MVAATWELNPKVTRESLEPEFRANPAQAWRNYGSVVTLSSENAIKDRTIVADRANRMRESPWDEARRSYKPWFRGARRVKYYMHFDLSLRRDAVGIGLCHAESRTGVGVVDLMTTYKPDFGKDVNFAYLRETYVYPLTARGFHVELVSFDQYQSAETQQVLQEKGYRTDTVSVDKTTEPYDTLIGLLLDGKLDYYLDPLFVKELQDLRLLNGKKYDHPRGGCFVGSTRVPLLDGTVPYIEDLAGRGDIWVYSTDACGRIVPAIARARKTKYTTELVDVYLDNGTVERCTPEHLWRLRDGSYRAASELRPGDRLMRCDRGTDHYGYERVSDRDGFRQHTHRLVAEAVHGPAPEGFIVHHANHNKLDNRPDNLIYVPRDQHAEHHTAVRHATDPQWVAKLRDGVRRFNRLPSTRAARSATARRVSREQRVMSARKRRAFRADITLSVIEAQRAALTANEAARALGCDRKVVLRVLRDEKGLDTWEAFLASPPGANHRVRAVVPVTSPVAVPVYDLEVDVYANFALASGAVVHNSKDMTDAVAGCIFTCFRDLLENPKQTPGQIKVFAPNRTWAPSYGKSAFE